MTIAEFKDKLIEDGVKSVLKREAREARRRGGVAGFELCRMLETPGDFDKLLTERHAEETELQRQHIDAEEYWEYRMATIQIEFVWERMKVAWRLPGPWSASAAIHYHDIVGE